jgi:hypothetical protein
MKKLQQELAKTPKVTIGFGDTPSSVGAHTPNTTSARQRRELKASAAAKTQKPRPNNKK